MAMDETFWPSQKVYDYTFNFMAMSCLLALVLGDYVIFSHMCPLQLQMSSKSSH
jgi:hypothetical protein